MRVVRRVGFKRLDLQPPPPPLKVFTVEHLGPPVGGGRCVIWDVDCVYYLFLPSLSVQQARKRESSTIILDYSSRYLTNIYQYLVRHLIVLALGVINVM